MNALIATLAFSACLSLISCSESSQSSNAVETTPSSEEMKIPTVFGIDGEEIPIRKSPDDKADKVINATASAAFGTTHYCTVDYSTKVEVLEKQNDWVKIKVVDPEWLTESHVGWIRAQHLVTEAEQNAQSIGPLDSSDYEIIATGHNNAVENYHVWLKKEGFDKKYVYQFAKQFRKDHCQRKCNLNIYDSRSIINLIGIYPLPDKDYLKMADHLISISSFDATEVRDWYPFQDIQYYKLGGKNWRKDPIK